jgi:hypothetical protein
MATVYPTVYPSDMPPMLARQEPSYEYIYIYKASLLCLYLTLFCIYCSLYFGILGTLPYMYD